MNLWARTLGQLAVLAVALFFFSCEDETSILGFKNRTPRFSVTYADIPIESSVLLLDSLRTSNLFSNTEPNRLLVGKYSDPGFGEVSATALAQYFTSNTSKALLKADAHFDSVSIQLRFDFYNYGSIFSSLQTISVHEVEKELTSDSLNYYFNKSHTPYSADVLGSKTFSIAPDFFKDAIENQDDTVITVNFPLDLAFGQRIFDSAVKYRDATTVADSAFIKRDFFKEFKGVAIVPESADKILGFDPAAAETRIILHYHDGETDSLELSLSLRGVSYSEIAGDRSGSELSGLTQYSQPFTPDIMRYVQSGTGVLTRLDFQNFYNFVDQDSNATMIVNSAELYLGTPEASSVFAPIDALSLRALKGEGFIKKVVDPAINKPQHLADSASVTLYAGQMGVTGGTFTPLDANGNVFTLSKSGANTFYNGFLTLFAQQIFKKDPNKERFRYFALTPESPPIGKSVNRLIFNKNNIRLRVYYTRPTQTLP